MTLQMRRELRTWIENEVLADRTSTNGEGVRLTAIVLKHRDTDAMIYRRKPDAGGWPDADVVAPAFEDRVSRHAKGFVGVQQYVLLGFWADKPRSIHPFNWMGTLTLPMTEGELCASIVDDFEAGKSPIEAVRERRLTLEYVLKIHGQWRAAQRAHTPKIAATRARRAPTKIPDARGHSAA